MALSNEFTPIAVTLIIAPFHAGAYKERVGKGPHEILNTNLVEHLLSSLRKSDPDRRPFYGPADVSVVEIDRVDTFEGEIGRTFEIKRRIAVAVRDAVDHGRFPIVLAGNCNSSVGVYSGLPEEADVVWFDAHPDFNTPDEVTGGYFDGMGVATLAGHAWKKLANTVPGFRPLMLDRLIYCGIRDFEPGQAEKVKDFGIRAIVGGEGQHSYAVELNQVLKDDHFGRPTLVHLDLDVLDSVTVGLVNEYAASGGMRPSQLFACLREVCTHRKPVAMTIASFNPDCSPERKSAIAVIAKTAATMVALAALGLTYEYDSQE